MQMDTIVKFSSILQCRKIPEDIGIRLENHFFPNCKQKPILKNQFLSFRKKTYSPKKTQTETLQIRKTLFSKPKTFKKVKVVGTILSEWNCYKTIVVPKSLL